MTVGQNNFSEIRYEYFRDRDVAFEAFKAGTFTWREEFTSRVWATGYDFPAVQEGRVKRETVPDHTPSATQGWFLNTRRPVFRDPRIREAIGLAFDFEWSNQNLMYGAYTRTASFFEKSDLKAEGCRRPRNWRCSNRSAERCPTRSSASRGRRRARTGRARTGRSCAAPTGSCARPAAPATAG